jgi:DnaJ-class molecular chaperone
MKLDIPDHYAVLGLNTRCTGGEIRAAYRRLAKRHHPDINAASCESAARTRELNAAHEILGDPAKRRAYDRELAARISRDPSVGRGKIERNIAKDVRLRIEDFIRGATLQVHINDPANPDGSETYALVVPPETAPGTRFRLPRSAPFEGGYVQVRLRALPGPRFQPRGSDLRTELRINVRRATQGGTEMMAGATGAPLRLSIPPGVARGGILRIPGEGLPKPRGGRGDLLVRITYRPEVRISRIPRR